MKNKCFYIIIVILLACICSCNEIEQEQDYCYFDDVLTNYNKEGSLYYLELDSSVDKYIFNEIDLSLCDIYQDGELINNKEVTLKEGNNYFTFKYEEDIETLVIYHKHSKMINILDNDDKVVSTYQVMEGNDNVLEEINQLKVKIPGYYWYQYLDYDKVVDLNNHQYYDLKSIYKKCTYTITYVINDQIQEVEVEYLSDFELLVPEDIDGYEFVGWYSDDCLFKETKYTYTSNITLTARFKETDKTKLNLNIFDYKYTALASHKADGCIVLPTPTLNNYQFVGWYYDKYFTKPVESIIYDQYNNEELYAKFELDNENVVGGTAYTLRNYQNKPDYDEISLFDKGVSPFATVYWLKIGIKVNNGKYYISTIGYHGTSLSELGDYDYMLYCYGTNDYYTTLTEMDIEVGMEVVFLHNPTSNDDSDVYNYISFIKK